MSYTVLARKYRSQTFDDVVGQEPIAQTLKNAIKTGRVAHAYLFAGTRGIGKTTMARVLAKALNCLTFDEPTTEPCCKCESCIAVNIGEDIDVIEIDGASNRGIENIRELRQNAIYRPARSRYKIYIIDEVHMLTTESFNALLKTLEEPPEHVKFIFATTEPNKVIATIQSRCQRFDFNNISPAAIAGHLGGILKLEKIKYEDDLVLPLAKMANGSMRDGLSLLDRLISTGGEPLTGKMLEEFLGCPNSEKVYNLISKMGDSDAAGTLAAIDDLINTGVGEPQIVDSLIDCMRDLMVVKSTGAQTELLTLTSEQQKRVVELAEKFDVAGLIYNITALEKLRWTIKNSDTARALLEASLLRFALSEHFLNVDSLISELKAGQGRDIKKKITVNPKPATQTSIEHAEPTTTPQVDLSSLADVDSIKNSWGSILEVISSEIGKVSGGLLNSTEPRRFEDGVLTIGFGLGGEMQKRMCESNGRTEAIESLLSKQFGRSVKLKFELTGNKQVETKSDSKQAQTSSQKRKGIVNDPAVKAVIIGLGATITGIDEE